MAGQAIQFVRPKLMETGTGQIAEPIADEVQKSKTEAITDLLKLIADKLD